MTPLPLSLYHLWYIIGCPHEEGIDYPDGQVCPQCPFCAHRDRWASELGR